MKHPFKRISSRRLAIVVVVLVAAVLLIVLLLPHRSLAPSLSNQRVTISHVTLYLEDAKTPAEQSLGLGNRSSLAKNSGMLFPISPPSIPTFWMKRMQFPLDFLWIRDSTIVDLTEHVAAPLASLTDDTLPRYRPKVAIDAVIEVNAGFVEYYKIKVGDEVKGL